MFLHPLIMEQDSKLDKAKLSLLKNEIMCFHYVAAEILTGGSATILDSLESYKTEL